MRFGLWRRGVDGDNLEARNEGFSLRAALLGGLLGGGSETTSAAASTSTSVSDYLTNSGKWLRCS
jgi:hypothetical protein